MKGTMLITGSTGMLGQDLIRTFHSEFSIFGLNRQIDNTLGLDHSYVADLSTSSSISNIVQEINPDIIIHTAAMVDIEYCEDNPKECMDTNFEAVVKLIDSIDNKVLFVYISTDSVFDGINKFPNEESIKNPINMYSRTKSLAEDYIFQHHINHIVVRTNFYGFHRNWRGSIVEWTITSLLNTERIGGFTDVFFNPLYSLQLAEAVQLLIFKVYRGVIHLGADEAISKFEFLKLISQLFNLNTDLIYKSSIDDQINKTKRPKNMSLGICKSRQILSEFDFSIITGLARLKEDLNNYWRNNKNEFRH